MRRSCRRHAAHRKDRRPRWSRSAGAGNFDRPLLV